MLTLSATSIDELFAGACAAVLEQGQDVAPRGLPTREVLGAWLCLTEPRRRVLTAPPRVINPAFAAAEAVWILSGSDESWIYEFNGKLVDYTDHGRLQGAYGPRLRRWATRPDPLDPGAHPLVEPVDQLERVVTLLDQDPDSRQAVVQLFDPARDHQGHRDVPCTLGWRFYLRQDRLHLHTTMRSQDLWLGFPYDVFTFTVLHELVAGWLGVALGEYHHHVDSLHLYEQHWGAARHVANPARMADVQIGSVPGVCSPMPSLQLPWRELDPLLNALATGAVPAALPAPQGRRDPDDGWAQIAAVMSSYRTWKGGDRDAARALIGSEPGVLTDALHRWYAHLATAAASTAAAPVCVAVTSADPMAEGVA